MSELLHTSLPVEYELRYGTACRNLHVSDFMRQTTADCIGGVYSAFAEEKALSVFPADPCPTVVNVFDAFVIGLNGR